MISGIVLYPGHSTELAAVRFVDHLISTRCTRGVRVVFSVTRMRSNNSARINKSDFTTEKNRVVYTRQCSKLLLVTMLSIRYNY